MPIAVPNPGPRLDSLASQSDPSVPLVSVHTPSRRPIPDPKDPCAADAVPTDPRPRPSLQIYYTCPPSSPDELKTVACTLETVVLKDRFLTSGASYERLDVYSLPTPDADENIKDELCPVAEADAAVQRCVTHQRAEIAARQQDASKEWYIQRYDVPEGEWRRALVVVRTPVAEWQWGRRGKKTGRGLVLSTVMFEHTRDGEEMVCVETGATEGEVRTLIRELRHELNWQHSYVQFMD